MRNTKSFLFLVVLLSVYIIGISLLMQQFTMYYLAYRNLSRLISDTSVELYDDTVEKGEE